MDQEKFDEKYLLLCMGLDQKAKEKFAVGKLNRDDIPFIDGPDSMKRGAESLEALPKLSRLHDLSVELGEAIFGRGSPIEGPQRKDYLYRVLGGLNTFTRVLMGEDIPYRERVRSYYEITPRKTPEDELLSRLNQLDEALPGRGSLKKRHMRWRSKQNVPRERTGEVLTSFIGETRKRARKIFELPRGERVEIELVKTAPWAGYNTFRGNGRSKVTINLQYPLTISRLMGLGTHESYPGHHVEHMLKEELLGKGEGFVEETVLTYCSPKCPVSEGIAQLGLDLIFDGGLRGALEWYNSNTRKGKIDTDTSLNVMDASTNLVTGARENAALMLHSDGESEDYVKGYLRAWLNFHPALVGGVMGFINHPLFETYIFNYRGEDHVKNAYRDALKAGVSKDVLVPRLYTTQLTPDTLHYLSDPV